MLEQIILGAIQGITEWLPVSSEGFVVLAKVNFFGGTGDINELIQLALLFHLGTFLAALIYLRKDVFKLSMALFRYKSVGVEYRIMLKFLMIATFISGIVGIIILQLLSNSIVSINVTFVNGIVGGLLLITGALGMRSKAPRETYKEVIDIKNSDSYLMGVVQGFAVLPGLSRSGLTVSTLLIRKFNDALALRLSFLMSLPIVLAGNIILNIGDLSFTFGNLWGIASAFVFGILTIHILLRVANRVNFNYFVIGFGVFILISTLIL